MSQISTREGVDIVKFHSSGLVALCEEVAGYVASGRAERDDVDVDKAAFIDDTRGRCYVVRFPRKTSVVTASNPTGEVRQCSRRDIHDRHDYQSGFGDYFNVTCLGNDGKTP